MSSEPRWQHGDCIVLRHRTSTSSSRSRGAPAGFDTLDWKLDLLVLADGAPRLKDEDELALAAAAGVLDPTAMRAAFERVLAKPPCRQAGRRARPTPRPARLPAGWDVV